MKNFVAHTDAIRLLDHVERESAELAYLDPPFFVGVKFRARESKGERAHGPVAYSDVWPSFDAYADWLTARLEVVHAALSDSGTMWLHLDQRAVHEMKVRADAIFGRARFLGEIIWVPGNGARKRSGPPMTHQTLLVYAKGDAFVWNVDDPALREPYAQTSTKMHFKNVDADGRAYRLRTINGKTYRYDLDRGRALGSVWSDCPAMLANTPLVRETTGYPTQKPLKLLDRIVRASSREGALVVDPFCGSGTTLVAANALGRRFFGCDVGERAIATARARLSDAGARFTLRAEKESRAEPSRATSKNRRGRARPSPRIDPSS
jgi:site-specific DNA-methyltransferase (adenine-specific)